MADGVSTERSEAAKLSLNGCFLLLTVEGGWCLSANVLALVSVFSFSEKLALAGTSRHSFCQTVCFLLKSRWELGAGCSDASTNESSSATAERDAPGGQKLLELNLSVY